MLMIDPPPAWRIAGMAAFVPRNTPLTLTAMMRSQSASDVSSIGARKRIPALFTSTFSLPYACTAVATAARQSPSRVTSRCTYVALPPLARISASTFLPSSSSTSPSTTAAPSRTNMRPSVAPWPRAPPLISATLPSSRPMIGLLLRVRFEPVDVRCDARLDRMLGAVADLGRAPEIGRGIGRGAGRFSRLEGRALCPRHRLQHRLERVAVRRGAARGDVVHAVVRLLRHVMLLDASGHVLHVRPVGLVVLEDLAVRPVAEVGLGVPGRAVAHAADWVVHAVVERTVDATDAQCDHVELRLDRVEMRVHLHALLEGRDLGRRCGRQGRGFALWHGRPGTRPPSCPATRDAGRTSARPRARSAGRPCRGDSPLVSRGCARAAP